MHTVMRQPLPLQARLVACFIASVASKGVASTSTAAIVAALAAPEPSSIRRAVRVLVDGGWLAVERSTSDLSTYRLLPGPDGPTGAVPTDLPPRSPETYPPGLDGPPPVSTDRPGPSGPTLARAEISLSDLPKISGEREDLQPPLSSQDRQVGWAAAAERALDEALRERGLGGYAGGTTDSNRCMVTVAECVDLVRGEAALNVALLSWARHFVSEYRIRTPKNFATYAQARAANAGRPVDVRSSEVRGKHAPDTTPLAGAKPSSTQIERERAAAAKLEQERAQAAPMPAELAALIGRPL